VSDRDSFIDEVAEEVRRDRLYGLMRRYGWIAVLVVVLIVGGASWREWTRAQDTTEARAFGDAILAALEAGEAETRVAALEAIEAPSPAAEALLAMMIASEAGIGEASADRLQAVAADGEVPQIYRQIAALKVLGSADLPLEERRLGLEGLAEAGEPLRLLAEEQLALIALETGAVSEARARLQAIVEDAETTPDLRLRATRLIVALGEDDTGAADGG
jgi:hypothetical protein